MDGRIVGGFTMVVGISTFAVVTAKVAEWLVRGDRLTLIEQDHPDARTQQPTPAALPTPRRAPNDTTE